MNGNLEKLAETMRDEEAVKAVFSQPTVEDAQKELRSRGVDLSTEEMDAFVAEVKESLSENAKEELEEENLSAVTGGSFSLRAVMRRIVKTFTPIVPLPPVWIVTSSIRRY